ncbi:carboxypeptidase regulatory-like domain-containing protein [uncultured Gimesia sp.]|uniref:carboxypeptidase regulatory-like domain-containing protein n=1 Tax=uncultured Gimesia sp. TaxID=1678688 RepID=UPI0030DC0B6A|tara:strand:- start:38925 stop:42575 length:3651 start_codon:yes stop_codon:yes gene_type:complete
MNWHALIDPEFSGRLCLTLIHSIWQVSLLALVVWCIDRFWRNASVERRYLLNVAALVTAIVAIPITYQLLDVTKPGINATNQAATRTKVVEPLPILSSNTPIKTELVASRKTRSSDPQRQRNTQTQSTKAASAPIVTPLTVSPPSQWLWLAPWIMAFYAVGVVLMLTRLIVASIRANRLGAHAVLVTEGPLVETLRSLAQQWSMNVVPALARAEQIVVPKVVGIVRPIILLPTSAISGLSIEELELILAHELAHVRRYDMWVNLLQRFAEAVLFFNPALWYLSRRISTLREYCCDEMTCRVQPASNSTSAFESRVQYATTLLRVAELAKRTTASSSDLASLAASGKSPSEMRRRVARLFGEPLREPLRVSRTGVFVLLALALALPLVSLVSTSTAQTVTKKEAPEKKTPLQKTPHSTSNPSKEKDGSRTFQLNVVGPADKPVPHALIEARTSPAVTAEQIHRGEYVRKSTYGPFVKTDEKGVLQLTIPAHPMRFNLSIKQPGYAPYWAGWNSSEHPETIPDEFTAQLETAWTVGGIIVDGAGKPIAGAKVSPSVNFQKRPGDTSQLGAGTKITTDAKGQWRYQHVPASKPEVQIAVNHPDYSPWRDRVSRSKFEVKENPPPTARIVLNRGLIITGSVTDEQGKPISGALVRTKFMNDIRKATTDELGVYLIPGCESRMTRVVVSAKGRALEMQEVRVAPEMTPVDFVLKPGGKIRVRVVDKNGNGIPKARIFFQQWRGNIDSFEFDTVHPYADENGVWEWNEAPLDKFQADICRPGGMQLTYQTLLAREAEYVFKPPKALVISGSVVDAKTKQPIKIFHVTPGYQTNIPQPRMSWNTSDSFESLDGKYQLRVTRDKPANFVRIEADGYEVTTSRAFKPDEENVHFDFSLAPAKDIAATILTATGEPAADAEIVVGVTGSQISIKEGKFGNSQTYATRLKSDAAGYFHIPPRNDPFQLVILHSAGFAHLKSDESPIPNPVELTPWARLEGTFRVGKQVAPHVRLTLFYNGINTFNDEGPHIFTGNEVTTDENGHFVFDRVFPGKCRVGREITFMVNEGTSEVTSSRRTKVDCFPDKTTTLELGGTGRRIIGKLAPPASYSGKVFWNMELLTLEGALPPPPAPLTTKQDFEDPERYNAWRIAYEAYLQLQSENTYFTVSIDIDGSFHIDDVPAGDYVLKMWHSKNLAGKLKEVQISVPASKINDTAAPVDLGTLTLQK